MPAHARTIVVHPDDGPSKDDVIAELRQLVTDLRDAAQDGRMLARRYADLLTSCVDEYCVEFEHRADRVLARLDEAAL